MLDKGKRGLCLVTGGAGFIGCAISHQLTTLFDSIVTVDNLHPQIHPRRVRPASLHASVRLIEADITQPATWDDLLQAIHPQVVVHLAAETGTGQSLAQASRHADVNVVGLTRMLDAFVERGVLPERIVLSSSRAVYGEGAWQNEMTGAVTYPGQRSHAQLERNEWDFPGLRPLPAASPATETHPTSVYGATKLAQEHIIRSWALSFDVQPVILRLQNVYGPGQSLSNPYTGIVPLFARLAREKNSIPIYEDGNILRDFVFIDDVAAAICAAASAKVPSPNAFDIGSGQVTSILELGSLIADFYGAPPPKITGSFRDGDIRCGSCDIQRTTVDLGWKPAWKLPEGLVALLEWIEHELGDNESRELRRAERSNPTELPVVQPQNSLSTPIPGPSR